MPKRRKSRIQNTAIHTSENSKYPSAPQSVVDTTPKKSSLGCGIMPHNNLPHFSICVSLREKFLTNRMPGGVQSKAQRFALQSGLATNPHAHPHVAASRQAGSAGPRAQGTPARLPQPQCTASMYRAWAACPPARAAQQPVAFRQTSA